MRRGEAGVQGGGPALVERRFPAAVPRALVLAAAAALPLLALAAFVAQPAAAEPQAQAHDIAVVEGGLVALGRDSLSASDGEAQPAQVRYTIVTAPVHGSLDRLGTPLASGASFSQAEVDASSIRYAHDGSEQATDSFQLQVFGPSGSGPLVTVYVQVSPSNDPPVAPELTLQLLEDTIGRAAPPVHDPDGPGLTITIQTQPEHGTAIGSGGFVLYTPQRDYFGPDEFRYILDDGAGGRSDGVARVTVKPVNDLPIGREDRYDVRPNQPLSVSRDVGVLANDIDPDADPEKPLIAYLWGTPKHGTLELDEDGSFTYAPEAGYLGWDRFTYLARDADTPPQWTPVLLLIRPNDAPLADFTADAWVIRIGGNATFRGVSQDGDGAIASQVWDLGDGTTMTGPTATHTYNHAGIYRVTMTVRDNEGAQRTVEHRLEVRRTDGVAPPLPVAQAGPDQTVRAGTRVHLDAVPAHYDQYWVQTGGPPVELQGAETPGLRFTAPAEPAALAFDLVAFDGWSASLPDRVTVEVLPESAFPIADAGSDVTVQAGQAVRLSGAARNATDEATLTFRWTQAAGDPVTLEPDGAALVFKAPAREQALRFRLVVLAGPAASHPDEVLVHVVAAEGVDGFRQSRAAGGEVRFSATVPGAEHAWDFGDGQTAEGPEAAHDFGPGRHVVRLTVTQADGSTQTFERAVFVPSSRRVGDPDAVPVSGLLGLGAGALAAVLLAGAVGLRIRRAGRRAAAGRAGAQARAGGRRTAGRPGSGPGLGRRP